MIRGLYLNQEMLDVKTGTRLLEKEILDFFFFFVLPDVLSIQLGNW